MTASPRLGLVAIVALGQLLLLLRVAGSSLPDAQLVAADQLQLVHALTALAALRRAGDLTTTEFNTAKARLLAPPPPPPPPPPRPVAPHHSGAGFNVLDFGAKGDGHTDCTAAFNAAFASAIRTYHELDCGKGCGRTVADVYVPSGHYMLSGAIDVGGLVSSGHRIEGVFPGVHGEGTAILQQTNASADIFYTEQAWRTQISGLHFLGGRRHLRLRKEGEK